MKTKTIMYCPLNDGYIISLIQTFIREKFYDVMGYHLPDKNVKLDGDNEFQKLICDLPVTQVQSEKLKFDTVVADYETANLLNKFWLEHKMELEKPTIPKSSEDVFFFVVAALMQLKTTWPGKHKAKTSKYEISADKSYSGDVLFIKGYRLSKVEIATSKHNGNEVSAKVWLDDNISITLSDLTAFGEPKEVVKKMKDEESLYEIIKETSMSHFHAGILVAPCIDEKFMASNHLEGINWQSEDKQHSARIDGSETLTKLKLSEKGVEVRAETVAVGRMVLGCSASSRPRTYHLNIEHGLVVDIRYDDELIFVAFVPQEKFIKS